MKKFIEVREEISAIRKRTKEIDAEMESIKRKERELVCADSIKERVVLREEHLEELKEMDSRFVALAAEEENAKLTVAILNNNAQIALFHEVLPEILAVLMKYKGKPYGEKTREKIRKEVEEQTSCGFWLDCTSYHQEVHFYVKGQYGKDFDTIASTHYENGDVKRILLDNKIQEVAFEDFHLCYTNRNYVEDVESHIEELRELRKKAVQKQKELEKICSQYNALCPMSMKHIVASEHIYEGMF